MRPVLEKLGAHGFPKVLAVLFALLVLAGLHGSSVGEWKRVFNEKSRQFSSFSIGKSRGIRVDDWCVSQPFIFAQCESKDFFPVVNEMVNGGTDMFLQTPCAPVWDWTALGQVHNWGYFLLGANRGTSWSWWIRYLGLPFFAYFFFLIWCRGDKKTSAVGALAVVLGAPTQWWDTTMPYHLLYFFSSLAMTQVVAAARGRLGIILGGLGLLVSLLSYFFVMYPVFEMLLLPVLVVLMVFVICNCLDRVHAWLRGVVLLIVLACFCCEMFYFFRVHGEALAIIANSAYPGTRVCHGGSLDFLCRRFLLDLVSLFTWGKGTTPSWVNQCQAAEYCSMFVPVSIAFVWLSVKRKRLDGSVLALLLIALVYVGWLASDWPLAMAKAMGFSRLPAPRVSVVEGFVVMLVALRLFVDLSESRPQWKAWIWMALAAGFLACRLAALAAVADMWKFVNASGVAMLRFEVALALSIAIWLSFLGGRRRLFLCLLLGLALLTGLPIHPLTNGLAPLYESEMARTVREIDAAQPGTWWSNDRAVAQLPLALGLRCLAGTQQYCDEAYWRIVDPTGAHKNVWNRYGHRFAVDFDGKPVFENRGRPDCIYHAVSGAQLRELGVRYVIWRGAELDSRDLQKVVKVGADTIYEVVAP